MDTIGDIVIIGPGAVGQTLGILASCAGLRVVAVGARRIERAGHLAGLIPGAQALPVEQATTLGDLVLLTVSDDAIEALCRNLSAADAFKPGSVVAHCSGALDSEILAPAKTAGCAVGSMHPLATFASPQRAIESIKNSYCFIEGNRQAAGVLERFALAIGAHPARLNRAQKPLYHSAAVMACNYVTALIDAAAELMAQAGIDRSTALEALAPLVCATVDNVTSAGPQAALTGPIARGDVDTLRRHLSAMAGLDELSALYRRLGLWTLGLAKRKGSLADQPAKSIFELLSQKSSNTGDADASEDH